MPSAKPTGSGTKIKASGASPDVGRKIMYIPLGRLRYDASNPRVVERLGADPPQEDVERVLLGEMRARELVPSFIENGYLPWEPLIVRKKGDAYEAIEGNRRLAALRSMAASQEPEEQEAVQTHRLDRVPCLLFDGQDRELMAYLGLRHLSKTKDWSTSAKARFVERVLKQGVGLAEAGRLTNTTTDALRLMLLTRRLFEQAVDLGLDVATAGAEGETFFWHLGDAVRRTRTKRYLNLVEGPDPLSTPSYDQSNLENLIGWLYGSSKTDQRRVIKSIRDIAKLDRCLANERAVRALEAGATLDQAEEELEAAGAGIAGHLERAARSIERACGGSWPDVDAQGLETIETALAKLRELLPQVKMLAGARRRKLRVPAEGTGP